MLTLEAVRPSILFLFPIVRVRLAVLIHDLSRFRETNRSPRRMERWDITTLPYPPGRILMKRLNYLCLVGLLFASAASAARGESIEWTRQLGTSAVDMSHGVSADGLGNVYISGDTTGSLGGPSAGGYDAFVSKYDAAGNFQWTRQLGTSSTDESYGVSADGLGNVYISGTPPAAWAGQTPAASTRLSASTMRRATSSGPGSWELVRSTVATACRPTAWGMSTSRAAPAAAWAGQTPAATTRLSASTMRRAHSSGRGNWELVRMT